MSRRDRQCFVRTLSHSLSICGWKGRAGSQGRLSRAVFAMEEAAEVTSGFLVANTNQQEVNN